MTLAIYALGVAGRASFVLLHHDPRRYVYSDMDMYMRQAARWSNAKYALGPIDATHPPGMGLLLGFFLERDPSLHGMVLFQLGVTCLVPLAVGALALAAFGRRSALAAIAAASLYFPFIDYGGYFLSEIYLALLAPLSMALFLWANVARRSAPSVLLLGLAAGLTFSLAWSMKVVALSAIGLFCAVLLVFQRVTPWRIKGLAAAAMILGALPLVGAISWRASAATGRYVLASNKSAADFLLGHYGRIRTITWVDPAGPTIGFGSPSAPQRGYKQERTLPFAVHDKERNRALAWSWVRAHPFDAVVLSLEHVYDMLLGTRTWPSSTTRLAPVVEVFHLVYVGLVLFPALLVCVDAARRDGRRGFLGSRELLLLTPILGVAAAVFLSTGEARYRVPFDGVLVILAVEFFRRRRALTPSGVSVRGSGATSSRRSHPPGSPFSSTASLRPGQLPLHLVPPPQSSAPTSQQQAFPVLAPQPSAQETEILEVPASETGCRTSSRGGSDSLHRRASSPSSVSPVPGVDPS